MVSVAYLLERCVTDVSGSDKIKWRREWDSEPEPLNAWRKLQITHCCPTRHCHISHSTLSDFARRGVSSARVFQRVGLLPRQRGTNVTKNLTQETYLISQLGSFHL
jgi:hypothetical protein